MNGEGVEGDEERGPYRRRPTDDKREAELPEKETPKSRWALSLKPSHKIQF